jgi:hypothetical protein
VLAVATLSPSLRTDTVTVNPGRSLAAAAKKALACAKLWSAERPRIDTALPGSTRQLNLWGPGLTRIEAGKRNNSWTG